ncbi:MAG: HAMP domain-containing protein [Armatimonadota bacterium]|nr:HAMP domain-containing protein [Armatimonadota bacterium]MDR7466293.1 HAMP domain-containing protein [Armatimonadota bacterium]MDR7493014.1 HAMP domain-containing protein [Armatimonadota bacterium]MDR7503694.1 HAMP domain-containing protein [Armatimonadota bacterium]MDR7545946.1 HAMP domain-containing protein [Armatimonadota bacterium]
MSARVVVAVGLRNRIMLLVALGVLVATAPLGVMGLAMVRAATDRVLAERLVMARTTAEHIDQELAQGWRSLNGLSARLSPHLARSDFRALRRELAVSYLQMPLFSGGIAYLDRGSKIRVAEPEEAVLFEPLARSPLLQQVLTSGRPQASSLIRRADGRPVVFFAVPVFDGPQWIAGALLGAIDLTTPALFTFIRGLPIGETGHAVLVGPDGIVLAGTDPDEVFSRNEHPDFFARLIAEGRPLVGASEERREPKGRSPLHLMAFAPLASAPWGLGIGQSEAETFGPLWRLRDRVLLFEVVVLAVALLFAWLDTGAVVAPLRLLQRGAERIAAGDLAQRIEVRRGDELGALGQSFETMRLRLLRSLEENARLQERLRSVAMVEERERIAREMHDSVGQVLGYVNTKVQAVHALVSQGQIPEALAHLEELELAARSVYADLREAILSLRTTTGPDRRLIPVLADYTRRFTELSGVDTRLVVEIDEVEFPPTTEVHLIRIVQEALTNVRKHAAARHAVVRLAARGGAIVVAVEDDGVGIGGKAAPPTAGFGLQTMRERAEAIGGTMTVGVRAGGGTVVEVVLPGMEEGRRARAAG